MLILQGISVRARPAVKEFRFYPNFVPNDNTNVSCPTNLTFTFTEANSDKVTIDITISPLDNTEDVQQKLNASLLNAGINTRIHVFVEFFGDQINEAGVKLSFVILNPYGSTSNSVPEIAVQGNTSNILCVNLNENDMIPEDLLSGRAEVVTVQNQTFPNSFKVGYENLTVMPGMRFTNDLPIDISSESLEGAIFDLFGWGCTNQPADQLLQSVSFYQTYENSDESTRDISTSFCGGSSLQNPRELWEVGNSDALAIGNNPFQVS